MSKAIRVLIRALSAAAISILASCGPSDASPVGKWQGEWQWNPPAGQCCSHTIFFRVEFLSSGDCTFYELYSGDGGGSETEPFCQWSALSDGRIEIRHGQQISFARLSRGRLELTQVTGSLLNGSENIELSRERANASRVIISGATITSGVRNGLTGPYPVDQRTRFSSPASVYLFVRYTRAVVGKDNFSVSLWREGSLAGSTCTPQISGGDQNYDFWCYWAVSASGNYEFRLFLNNELKGRYAFSVM